ncbi:hypothetical protein DFJ74DRAFT_728954 [Hyaloraphidium curvatum]|nr:hypothetical protein DFJ74DRAFT_728954 [Hyaloraphidium curvatum]
MAQLLLRGCSASLARHALSTSSSTALYQLAQLLRHAACEAQHRAPPTAVRPHCVVLCFGLVVFAFSEAGMPVRPCGAPSCSPGCSPGLAKRDPTFATASFAIAVPAYAAGRAVLRCIRETPGQLAARGAVPPARELCAALELLAARMGLQMDEAGVPPDAGFLGELLGIEAGTLASRGFSGGLRSATLSAEEEAAEALLSLTPPPLLP